MMRKHPKIMTSRFLITALTIILLAASHSAVSAEPEDIEDVILVYGENLPDWRNYVVDLLGEDSDLDATIIPINTSDCLSVALLFPNVKAAVLMGQNADVVRGIEAQVLTAFKHGGGLVGFHDFTSLEVAPDLAQRVFPLFANVSRLGRFKEGSFVQSLKKVDPHPVTEDLPSDLDISDPEINLALNTRSNKWSGKIPDSGELTILYEDAVYGAPVVSVFSDEGFSVSFAGGDIDNSPDNKLKYFGNLFFDETFQEILLNSVSWVAEEETRTEIQAQETLDELQRINLWEQDVKDSAKRAKAQRAATELGFKAGVNILGIAAIVVIYLKLIRRGAN